jgi:hypothetical protein
MADYDRRQPGGGGGGYNNRKRRNRGKQLFGDDNSSTTGFILPCGIAIRGLWTKLEVSSYSHLLMGTDLDDDEYDRRPQRRRYDAPLHVRVRKQLLGLAETPLRRWDEEVQSIAQIIAENYDDDKELQASFLDLVLQMVLEQPLKTPFVAAVVLVVNASNPGIVDALLTRITSATEERVKEGEWRDVKLCLKFLACLQSLLEGDGLFPVLDELFSRAVDLQTASSEDVSSESSLPSRRLYFAHDSLLDHWNRACQDHPSHYPLHLGCRTFSTVATEGRRAYG